MKYRFSGFILDPARHHMLGADGRPVNLSSRVFDTLLFMVEHPGELLDKATLMSAVWPDTVVEENSLNQSVTALRKALGEKPGDHRFIVTEPGRGYRFVADVEVLDEASETGTAKPEAGLAPTASDIEPKPGIMPSARRKAPLVTAALVIVPALIVGYLFYRPASEGTESTQQPQPATSVLVAPPPVPQSVAVLPFADMSPGGDQTYFADGIAEELLNQLARLDGLHVAGRTSSFSFRDKDEDLPAIGRALNVAHILEGSVRKAGDRVRITVQLVKAADGYHVWSQSFDRDLEDIFAVQEEIAMAVADALSVTLGASVDELAQRRAPSFEAYDAFLQAQSLMLQLGTENVSEAIELLESVVRMEPLYAEAWSQLAVAYEWAANVYLTDRAEEFRQKEARAAARAVEIAPKALSSLRAMASQHWKAGDLLQAERSLQKALSLAPGDPDSNGYYGWFLRTVGRPGDAIDYFRRVVQVEPLALGPSLQLVMSYQAHGDIDAARDMLDRCAALIGDPVMLNGVALGFAMENEDRQMVDRHMKIMEQDPATPPAGRELSIAMRKLYDSPAAAREFLRGSYREPEYQDPPSRAIIAIYASFFGDPELALIEWGELQQQGALLFDGIWFAIHANTRRQPLFKDLVRAAGLVDYWRASGNWGEFCRPVGDDDFACR